MTKSAPKKVPGRKASNSRSPRRGASAQVKPGAQSSPEQQDQIEVQVKRGRPSKFEPSFVRQAEQLCVLGATDEEVAQFFEVDVRTIYRWKVDNQAFCQALKRGKELADERVERSLYARAVGYTFDSEKVFQYQGAVVRANTKEHVPPDTTAMIFWLKNRRPDDWREKQEIEVKHENTRVVLPNGE